MSWIELSEKTNVRLITVILHIAWRTIRLGSVCVARVLRESSHFNCFATRVSFVRLHGNTIFTRPYSWPLGPQQLHLTCITLDAVCIKAAVKGNNLWRASCERLHVILIIKHYASHIGYIILYMETGYTCLSFEPFEAEARLNNI
jgi:hypothetical protein